MKAGVSVQAGVQSDSNGTLVTSAKFKVKKSNWLPSDAEQSCVHSLMQHVAESEKNGGLDGVARLRHQRSSTCLHRDEVVKQSLAGVEVVKYPQWHPSKVES